ncbi:hypothetical protein P691DRAFT_776146 [Macrolepiota fuliginosa MF-IS2]|uniref:Uncharacterized protein n=1 Tax=Macrolepiota fuliginosa MF-IS2 TaxID=1400762 RepID=A0A9P6C0J8_9AGAR|nr:hypothetical protein P691DRAFT_776146 [Macrolepiota fuliginosa MF-IS2]
MEKKGTGNVRFRQHPQSLNTSAPAHQRYRYCCRPPRPTPCNLLPPSIPAFTCFRLLLDVTIKRALKAFPHWIRLPSVPCLLSVYLVIVFGHMLTINT